MAKYLVSIDAGETIGHGELLNAIWEYLSEKGYSPAHVLIKGVSDED